MGIEFHSSVKHGRILLLIDFDTILDFDRLRKKFKLMDNIVLHENLDPKSGTEKGFIDKRTGEGLMGKLR
jgi:hypothetical protein